MGAVSLQRYQLRGVLGRGGTGVVYEAYDAKNDSVVALKTIEGSSAESLYRLKQEFRALTDVQHPNLVRFGELSYEEGRWFFTMELVRGTNFVEYVRPRRSGPPAREASRLDEGRLRATLPQLVAALTAIHDAGHVHRDVKTSNVLVSSEGRVVLLDFGLVIALGAASAAAAPGILGTPDFMAPEQAEGNAVGPAADWYAVGVMLFLALTGRLPFDGFGTDVLAAKLTRAAPSVHTIAPDAPADLADLCADLLHGDPADRPDADAIRARLGPSSGETTVATAISSDPVGPFVGRVREHEAIERALADVTTRGERRIVVLEGEPGVGKSALVQRFLAGVGGRAIVLTGRCYEQETVPLKGIDGIVDVLSEYLLARTDAEVEPLVAGGVRYLATVFPVLRRVPMIAGALTQGGVDNQTALRHLAFGELERMIDALARRAPLVIFLDDLQWADADSLALLARLVLAPGRAPSLFLATMRAGGELTPELTALVAAGERITIGGLGEDESRALWNALLPADVASPETRAWAMREADGHPFFLAELARSARAGGLLEDRARAPLEDVLWARVQGRDPIEQRFLEMVALAGAPTPYELLAAAAGVDVGECLTRLGGLRAAQLVRITRRGEERLIEPYHDRVREAIAGHVAIAGGPRAMLDRHLRLGRVLRDATRAENGANVFAIVQHLHAARELLEPDERAALAALHLAASRHARLATAYDRARAHARDGLALLGDGGWTSSYAVARDLSIAAIEAEYLGGKPEEARRAFESTRARLADVGDRTALAIAWIGLETGSGHCEEALAAGRAELRELGTPLPTRVSMLGVLARYVATRRAQGSRSIDALVKLDTLADPARVSAVRILVALAPAAFFLDTNLVTWMLLRIAGISMTHGVCDASSYGIMGYGSVLAGAFHAHEQGYAFGRAALALNERFANDALAAKLHNIFGGYITHWTRPFAEGIALLRAAYDLATKSGDTSYETYSATVLSVVSFSANADLAAFQALAEWAREVGDRRADRDMAKVADVHARYAATLRGLGTGAGDLGAAASTDAELRASLSDKVTPVALFHYNLCRAELAYRAGDAGAAHAFLGEAARRKQVAFSVPPSVELCFLEALVAARRFDDASIAMRPWLVIAVAARVRMLARWARSCPANYEAYHRIAHAELARILGRGETARARYDAAIESARAHGAPKREALALDLAARHARRSGDAARASTFARAAAEACARWGAAVKPTLE